MKKVFLLSAALLAFAICAGAQDQEEVQYNQYGQKVESLAIDARLQDGILVFQNKAANYKMWFDVRVQGDAAAFFGYDKNLVSIGNGKMDIKTFVQSVDGLEQWNPLMKGEFPISAEVLRNEVYPAFMVECPELTKDTYTYEEFIAMVKSNPDLAAVRVHKQRFGYMVNNTICEFGNVLINGAKVVTINSESTEIEDIKKTIADCHLEGVENINYLQAIKRVIGMSDKPLANE